MTAQITTKEQFTTEETTPIEQQDGRTLLTTMPASQLRWIGAYAAAGVAASVSATAIAYLVAQRARMRHQRQTSRFGSRFGRTAAQYSRRLGRLGARARQVWLPKVKLAHLAHIR